MPTDSGSATLLVCACAAAESSRGREFTGRCIPPFLSLHRPSLQEFAVRDPKNMQDALEVKILPAIIVDSQYDASPQNLRLKGIHATKHVAEVVIDGHHRLELFKAAGMTIVLGA